METHPHAHVEHHRTGHNLLDLVVSISALVISAVSILLAYHTGHNMERLVHANSWPALQLMSANNGESGRQLSFGIVNAGVGPARIHALEFLIDGVAIPWQQYKTFRSVLDACCAEPVRRARAADGEHWDEELGTAPIAGSFLSPRETAYALRWQRTEANAEPWDALDRARQKHRVKMRACYCSVFDECWIAETDAFPPRPVSACASSPPESGGH